MWNELHIDNGLAMIFGLISPDTDYRGEGVLVTVELATGVTKEIPLPGVEVGTTGELELPQNGTTTFDANPAVVWDDEGSRLLIVEVNRDIVSEISPTTGEVVQHQFGSEAPNSTPTVDGPFTTGQRSAALGGPNGQVLYVASGVQTFELIDEYLTARFDPLGIEAIDTDTWKVVDRLDVPITYISMSTDGNRLLATGQSYEDNRESQRSQSSGLYVLDAGNLAVIAHHGDEEPDRYFGGFSMNPEMSLGYVQSWEQATTIDVIDLDAGSIVASRSGAELQLMAEAGILVDTSFGSS
jgi:hypothetical protein